MQIKGRVAVIMGSDSDLPVMKKATDFLDSLGIEFDVHISSAHRAIKKTLALTEGAEERGIDVIIAGAGAAAHLPGVIAAATTLPVIGVPIQSGPLKGQDALYAMVQMPSGIPVATVAINGAKNAAILAAEILAIKDTSIKEQLAQMKENLAETVERKDAKLQDIGIDQYLIEK